MRTVVVDGVELPEALIAQEAQNHPGASAAEAWTAAGHALAIKALLLHRASELGLSPSPELDDGGREETPEEALVRAVLEAELDVASPSEAECRRVYDAERRRFRTPALYEASHILIEPRGADEAALGAAQNGARGLIRQLIEDPGAFAELARAHSACSSSTTGGSLGQLKPGDLIPEIEQVLEALSPGETAVEPVLSRFGWHVLKLDRRIEGRELPFDLVKDRIRTHLESRAWAAAAASYVAELAQAARAQGIALSLAEDGAIREGSLTLGQVLADRDAAARLESWLAATDPELLARLAEAAETAGAPPVLFVQDAMADFMASATDESWTQLISAAQGAEDPGLACLGAVIRSKLLPKKRNFTLIRRS